MDAAKTENNEERKRQKDKQINQLISVYKNYATDGGLGDLGVYNNLIP